jgi:hypothetical protein
MLKADLRASALVCGLERDGDIVAKRKDRGPL